MTNVRNLALPQWRRLAEHAENRCLVPVTEFAEWKPDFWQNTAEGPGFSMVTCDPDPVVALIHPKAMVTILVPEDHDRWLTCGYDEAVSLQRPLPAERMTVRGPVFPTRQDTLGSGIRAT